jgi:GWxTD domain-containing protein
MKAMRIAMGAALKWLPLLSLMLVWPLATAGFAWDADRDFPSPSQGDIVFHVDIVTFYDSAGRNVEEIYCTVPNDQIEFVESNGRFRGRLRYKVDLADAAGKLIETTEKTVDVFASAEDTQKRSVVQVLQSKISVAPGRYTVKVALHDLHARKKTILSYLLRRYKSGEAEVTVDSREFGAGGVSISDIEFARSVRRTAEGGFQKSGYEIIPNAQRRFGRLLPEMAVFFEVYDLRGHVEPESLSITYSILNREGRTVYSNQMPMVVRGERSAATALFDLTSLTNGGYDLDLTLRDPAGDVLAASSRRFDVAWSSLSWGKYDSEMIEDMAFVLTEKEMDRFKALSPGERERFLVDFWKGLDPTPGTSDNEAMLEHYRRVAYADEHYGTAGVRGAVTDRGKIYIKYGPPDDVQSYFSDYEFIRDKRDMEGGTEPVPTDPFARVGIKASGDAGGAQADAYADQRGGTTVHGKPYETWTYDGPGYPVRRLADRLASSAGMRFMFVDERGVGDYKMVYSTEKLEY